MKKQGTSFQDQTACFFVFSLSLSLSERQIQEEAKGRQQLWNPSSERWVFGYSPDFPLVLVFWNVSVFSLSFCVFKEERIMKLPSDSLSTASSSSASLSLAYTKLWVRPVLKKCIIKSDLYPFFPVSGRDRRPGNLLNLHFLIITKKIASCIA